MSEYDQTALPPRIRHHLRSATSVQSETAASLAQQPQDEADQAAEDQTSDDRKVEGEAAVPPDDVARELAHVRHAARQMRKAPRTSRTAPSPISIRPTCGSPSKPCIVAILDHIRMNQHVFVRIR